MKKITCILILFYLILFGYKHALAVIIQKSYELTDSDMIYSFLKRDDDYTDFIKEYKKKGYTGGIKKFGTTLL